MKALRYNVAATARDTQSTIGSGRGDDDDDADHYDHYDDDDDDDEA